MKYKIEYTIKPGAYLVIWLTGQVRKYIAEVTRVDPLRLKVTETGPLANLKEEDIIIIDTDTSMIQKDHRSQQQLLTREKLYGRPLLSGLQSLGVGDDIVHEILPIHSVTAKV